MLRFVAWPFLLQLVACSSATNDSCKSRFPASQAASAPCCPDWGVDACGASLFCAALDGRTQPTCYPEHSRLPNQSCTADVQCISFSCATSGVCKGIPGGSCTPEVGCGSGVSNDSRN
jgi:hypothetical protein